MKLNRLFLATAAAALFPLLSFSQTTIYVSAGDFASPPYVFFLDADGEVPFHIQNGGTHALNINETYEFGCLSGALTHPFYISDRGAFNEPLNISLSGDGNVNDGIFGSQAFTLAFDSFDVGNDTLTYYCTAHSSMFGTINVIPEPSTYAFLGGTLAFVVVMLRRRFKKQY